MGALLEQIAEWLKGMLVDGIMNNLSGMFDAVNRQVADVASQVGSTPASFSPGVFALVRNISESVIIYPCPEGSYSGQNQGISQSDQKAAHLLRTGGTHRCAVFLFDQERRFNEPRRYEHDHHHDPHVPAGDV